MTKPFWAAATGVGAMPGTVVRESMRLLAGELPWPHLPELPNRGPGADPVGRAGAVLVDLPVETTVDGWQLAARPGRDLRRARSLLAEDLDALAEALAEYAGPLKLQLVGPLTLATGLASRGGHRAVADPSALADLTSSLAEGLRIHLDDVHRRVPLAQLSLQFDEPLLPAVLAGEIPTPSGFGRVRAVAGADAALLLASVVDAARAVDCHVLVRCGDADPPLDLLGGLAVEGAWLDPSLTACRDDEVARWVDSGRLLLVGTVPVTGPLPTDAAAAAAVRALARRIGFGGPAGLRRFVVTPAGGLGGSTSEQARTVVTAVRRAGERLQDDPEGEGSGR